MRGEHCVAGASILSAIAVIMLIFVNIGQINTGPVCNGIFMAQVDVAPYGATWVAVANVSAGGLYDTNNDPLGSGKGLRQNYKYGLYNLCAYQKDGSGICSPAAFGYPMEGMDDIIADIPASFRQTTLDITGQTTFKDGGYNTNMSRAGNVFIFLGSLLALGALIFGAIKARIFFLIAVACSSGSAFFLMLGAALWSALIAKDATINTNMAGKFQVGMFIYPGAGLYLTWVAFVLMTLAVVPYVVSCLTFRRHK